MNEREMQDYIMHYGVKGMRWGVRKKRYESNNMGSEHYMSGDTAYYKNVAQRAKEKAAKYNYKANKTKSSRKRDKFLSKANKKTAKSAKFNRYAKKSAALDKRANELYKTQRSQAKNIVTRTLADLKASTSYYQEVALSEKTPLGKAYLMDFLYGGDHVSDARDTYVRSR